MKRLMVNLILLSLSAQPLLALAQAPAGTNSGEWEVVKEVPFGSEIEVVLNDRRKLKGRLHNVTDSKLAISLKKEITELDRSSVQRIYRLYAKPEQFKKMASGVGGAIGGAIGLGISISIAQRPRNHTLGSYTLTDRRPSSAVIVIPLVGIGLGSLGGYLLGDRIKSRMLIYDARSPQQATPAKSDGKKS